MSWKVDGAPDWAGFENDFVPDAQLFPLARPTSSQSLAAFMARMDSLVGTTLRSLEEVVLGTSTTLAVLLQAVV